MLKVNAFIYIFILALCSRVAATSIALVPIDDVEFASYFEGAVENYAHELELSGISKSLALLQAQEDFTRLLPLGKDSPNQFIMSIVDEDLRLKVGVLFYELDSEYYFINDFVIYEPYRNKGYGTLALLELEKIARATGLKAISLHVFNHNLGAKRMYDRLGYVKYEPCEIVGIFVGQFLKKNLS